MLHRASGVKWAPVEAGQLAGSRRQPVATRTRGHYRVSKGAILQAPVPFRRLLASAHGSTRRCTQLAMAASQSQEAYYLGIDFGTSGARAAVVNGDGRPIAESRQEYDTSQDWGATWESALWGLIAALPAEVVAAVKAVAIDGTSATTMLIDEKDGALLAPAKLYNEAQDTEVAARVKAIAPPQHTTTAPTSALCKVMAWQDEGLLADVQREGHQPRVLHQADWAAYKLHGLADVTDFNNSLKLGYDPQEEAYPSWLASQEFAPLLPRRVVAPGQPVAKVQLEVAQRTGLPADCVVCGGTTDSIAAFIAAGLSEPGEAVTSLGSTMAIKMISTVRVDDASFGIYSHRLGDVWLVGGASNTGGAVLKKYFTAAELKALSSQIDPAKASGLDYYPLTKPGERFPILDPDLQPRLEPRPESDAQFLHGMLEGIAKAEAQAFSLLRDLGADPLCRVLTAGGGANNPTWTAIRQNLLGVPVGVSPNGEASYGVALLARQGAQKAEA
mmetsp:Transcript_13837/g.35766  ORF Transcript_13837/g.35766 Transcript_13837/m.35766 type:complete len:501 (-) Transcript_13837:39-1541(-)